MSSFVEREIAELGLELERKIAELGLERLRRWRWRGCRRVWGTGRRISLCVGTRRDRRGRWRQRRRRLRGGQGRLWGLWLGGVVGFGGGEVGGSDADLELWEKASSFVWNENGFLVFSLKKHCSLWLWDEEVEEDLWLNVVRRFKILEWERRVTVN